MQISTTARHCELDPELRLFAQKRLEKFERFARDIQEAHLVLTAQGYRHSAEITLKLKRQDLVSRMESTEARAAIDRAADRLERQLRRLKEKRVSRKRGTVSANGRVGAAPEAAEEIPGEFGDGVVGGD
jgi:putative sigma-54 modulation protein